jgi:transcription-repair coupling factor (superfamily II helicase)
LLTQAVGELKERGLQAETVTTEIEQLPVIELPLQAYLPEDYVPHEDLRLRMYQRLVGLDGEEELDDVRKELEDRFGILPPPAEDLLYVLRVRLLAARAGVRAIGREDNNLVLRLSARAQERAGKVTPHFGRRAWVGRGQMWLALKEDQGDWRTVLITLLLRLGEQGDHDVKGVQK